MSFLGRPFYDFAPGPVNWQTPDKSKPALPLPSFWNSFQAPSLFKQATYKPFNDMDAAVRRAYDEQIKQHNAVAKDNTTALLSGVNNWITRNRQY